MRDGQAGTLPALYDDKILLAHGSGGRMMQELIERLLKPRLLDPAIRVLDDAAVWQQEAGRMALTTDSFVVDPIFFPGGDIGDLAVNGTVNDLAVSGARPLYLSVGLILEEGLPVADLERILISMRRAAERAGVAIVTGDTKVVNRNQCDRIFINTTGVGAVPADVRLGADRARAGDRILLSGPIAAHGVAVMGGRENLSFAREIRSDTAPLNGVAAALLEAVPGVRCMRDATRGGIASVLNELAEASSAGIRLREDAIPVQDEVLGACEILGLDPLYVANEGCLVAIVPPEDVSLALTAMRAHEPGVHAAEVGEVVADHAGKVMLRTAVGGYRMVDMLTGELLPRIC